MGKRLMFIMNILFIFIVGILFYQAFKIHLMKSAINNEITMLDDKINEYTEKKKKLETNIKNFSEEEKVERIARDRLNLKKEGEIVYKIVE